MRQTGQTRQQARGIKIAGRYIYLALIFLPLIPLSTIADDRLAAYQLKAAYIYNFTKFIDWQGRKENETHIRICIDSSDDIYHLFQENLNQKQVNKQIIEVIQYSTSLDIKSCAILFTATDAKTGPQASDGMLTIGESPEFIQQGGMIRFFLESKKLRFEINPDQANKYNVSISSKLLRLAKITRIKTPAEEINND